MWYLTMMVTEVGTNGIFVVLLRFALVTVLWSAAPNSVVFDVLPSAFKQYSSLLWFTGFVSAATLDAMLYAATGGPASRRFCSLLGFATAWFAFDFVGAATIIFCCFQPAFVTEMIFDRSLQNMVSGHEIVLLFLVSVVGKMWYLAALHFGSWRCSCIVPWYLEAWSKIKKAVKGYVSPGNGEVQSR